jgi:hypothetical protein
MFYTLKTAAGDEFGVSEDGKQVRIACAKCNVLELNAMQAKELQAWIATIAIDEPTPVVT